MHCQAGAISSLTADDHLDAQRGGEMDPVQTSVEFPARKGTFGSRNRVRLPLIASSSEATDGTPDGFAQTREELSQTREYCVRLSPSGLESSSRGPLSVSMSRGSTMRVMASDESIRSPAGLQMRLSPISVGAPPEHVSRPRSISPAPHSPSQPRIIACLHNVDPATALHELEVALPTHALTSLVPCPIYFGGRDGSHDVFLDMADRAAFSRTLKTFQEEGRLLHGKHIVVRLATQQELIWHLFPSLRKQNIQLEPRLPIEFAATMEAIRAPLSREAHERAFARLAAQIVTFPWHRHDLYGPEDIDQACHWITIAIDALMGQPKRLLRHHALFHFLKNSLLACPAFPVSFKQAADIRWPTSEGQAALPLPPVSSQAPPLRMIPQLMSPHLNGHFSPIPSPVHMDHIASMPPEPPLHFHHMQNLARSRFGSLPPGVAHDSFQPGQPLMA